MRGAAGAEGRRLYGLGAGDLPPMEARRFRWWADELAAAPPLPPRSPSPSPSPPPPPPTKPSRRTLGKARAPKKRSISDLFAAAPPLALPSSDSGGGGNDDDDDDEALCAIMRRAREKKRKRRLQEEAAGAASAPVAAAAAAAETRDSEGNFTRKVPDARVRAASGSRAHLPTRTLRPRRFNHMNSTSDDAISD
ncbi:hypothetical protein [Oryza sativa Japonica Group]|uniref:Uncharacterized protein n=1 Tax=Oryza sativa subsp. japonica TaxID=39947 RepID=Q9AWI7_ORYSJ|nr:hypothetical protein [Oryza sativa Japonica Group]